MSQYLMNDLPGSPLRNGYEIPLQDGTLLQTPEGEEARMGQTEDERLITN